MANLVTRFKAARQVFLAGSPARRRQKSLPFGWPTLTQGVPEWHLVDLDAYIAEGFNMNSLVYSAIMYKVRATLTAPLRAYSGDEKNPEELPKDNPLQARLLQPNEYQSWAEFQSRNVVFFNVAGNVYIYIDPNTGEMHSLNPARVYIIPRAGKVAELAGFLYVPVGKSVQNTDECIKIINDDVLHIKLPNPSDPLEGMGYGMSPMQPAAQVIDVDNMITKFLNIFFKRGAMVSGVLQFDRPLNDETVDTVIERWEEKYGGYEKWGV